MKKSIVFGVFVKNFIVFFIIFLVSRWFWWCVANNHFGSVRKGWHYCVFLLNIWVDSSSESEATFFLQKRSLKIFPMGISSYNQNNQNFLEKKQLQNLYQKNDSLCRTKSWLVVLPVVYIHSIVQSIGPDPWWWRPLSPPSKWWSWRYRLSLRVQFWGCSFHPLIKKKFFLDYFFRCVLPKSLHKTFFNHTLFFLFSVTHLTLKKNNKIFFLQKRLENFKSIFFRLYFSFDFFTVFIWISLGSFWFLGFLRFFRCVLWN